MTADALPSARKPLTPSRALLFGGLTVGTLDILDAFVFNGFRGIHSPGTCSGAPALPALPHLFCPVLISRWPD